MTVLWFVVLVLSCVSVGSLFTTQYFSSKRLAAEANAQEMSDLLDETLKAGSAARADQLAALARLVDKLRAGEMPPRWRGHLDELALSIEKLAAAEVDVAAALGDGYAAEPRVKAARRPGPMMRERIRRRDERARARGRRKRRDRIAMRKVDGADTEGPTFLVVSRHQSDALTTALDGYVPCQCSCGAPATTVLDRGEGEPICDWCADNPRECET